MIDRLVNDSTRNQRLTEAMEQRVALLEGQAAAMQDNAHRLNEARRHDRFRLVPHTSDPREDINIAKTIANGLSATRRMQLEL